MSKAKKLTVTMDTVVCDHERSIYGKVSDLAKKNGTIDHRHQTFVFLKAQADEILDEKDTDSNNYEEHFFTNMPSSLVISLI